jgi:hypothetical protein
MLKKYGPAISASYHQLFKREDTRFMIFVGLKVAGISLMITLFMNFFLYEVMRLNLAFFKANGFPNLEDDSAFFDYIAGGAIDNLPFIFVFHIFLFFIGVYVGWIILRPFRVMGDYALSTIENPHAIYKTDEFSTYKLLTRFSEFFFEYLRECRKRGELSVNSIPPQYARIHQPVLDKVFMLHFGLLLTIISISSAVFINENTGLVFQKMIELAAKTLHNPRVVRLYFQDQYFLLDDLVILTIILITTLYTALGFHLYNKVSGAAFGIFSTMRAFMKGNHFNRVHLVGYGYLREHTRKLNKYLDFMENNYDKGKPKG